MDAKIRPFNWERRDSNGIPYDAKDIIDYFNTALKQRSYHYVPRKIQITPEEISNLWIPGKDKNIAIVADIEGKVVGAGNVLFCNNSNQYSKDYKRDLGEYTITINPEFIGQGIGTEITREIIKELEKKEILAQVHVSKENERMNNLLKKLGYKPKKLLELERYRNAGLNPLVYFYILP